MVINEVLWILFTYSSFISGDIHLERVIFIHNLTTWVKCTLSIIYIQLSNNYYTHWMMFFEKWIVKIITEVLWNIYLFLIY